MTAGSKCTGAQTEMNPNSEITQRIGEAKLATKRSKASPYIQSKEKNEKLNLPYLTSRSIEQGQPKKTISKAEKI